MDSPKPLLNVCTLGHGGHGKTTLAAAITTVLAKQVGGQGLAYVDINNPPLIKSGAIAVPCAHLEYETATRRYQHADCPTPRDAMKRLITGNVQMDGAILVVAATDGPMSTTLEQIQLARQLGICHLVVFMNKCDQAGDAYMVDLFEREVRDLLTEHGFSDANTPIVRGSALAALQGTLEGEEQICELLRHLDTVIPPPVNILEKPFFMPIETVATVAGRGTVVSGRVEQGVIKVGEEAEVVGFNAPRKTVVTSVEMFRKLLYEGRAGEPIGIGLEGMKPDEIQRGQLLARPGSIRPYTQFESHVYICTKEEGGRHTPFGMGYRPQFRFYATDITGAIELPDRLMMAMPGDDITMVVTVDLPVAITTGTRFTLYESGRTVGVGFVSKLIA